MKKIILKSVFTIALVALFSLKSNAQNGGTTCNNGSCSTCMTIDFKDIRGLINGACLTSFFWHYPGSPNCGDVLAFVGNGNNAVIMQAECKKCCVGDNNCGPCQCPSNLFVYLGPTGGAIPPVASISFGPPPVGSSYPYTNVINISGGVTGCNFNIVVEMLSPILCNITVTP